MNTQVYTDATAYGRLRAVSSPPHPITIRSIEAPPFVAGVIGLVRWLARIAA